MRALITFLFTVLIVAFTPVRAHEAHTDHHSQENLAIGVAMANDKTLQAQLWRASVSDDFLLVDHSEDLGKTFSKAVKVNAQAMKIAAKGEARPKIAVNQEGLIFLTWTESLKERFAGYVWFARSIDGGKTFEKPYIVHQDRAKTTHRFDALNVSENGVITVTWVDKRDLIAAKASGQRYQGAAIYYAVSTDEGKSFQTERKLADNSCECCRIAMTNKPDGTVVALWRHVFDGDERDHMVAELPNNNTAIALHRATFGRWKIDGCPHHGAALVRGGEGNDWWGYHMAYFDGKEKNPGLYYSRMDGVAWASSPAKLFGNAKQQAGHPVLLSQADQVWLAWRELSGNQYKILMRFSDDGGHNWQDDQTIAVSEGETDYPFLLSNQHKVYLVWNTKAWGLIVKEVK
jgi:hypothetical protein